ncbi:MAG: UDP-N-acetylmuramoyl-L-alanyl-D-glutamate--2,6-diaminopimelate ligase [Rudaea sp.]
MQLDTLLRALPDSVVQGPAGITVTGITADSRRVEPGFLFVAVPGVDVDGARYIPDAISRGAAAVVSQSALAEQPAVPVVRVSNARSALAFLAAAWHQYPSRNLRIIGVTGTDGKTTTSTLIENILLAAGHTVGTITTVAAHIGGREIDTGFHTTTPDAPEIQGYLAQMVTAGTEYAVIESTSHGLEQHRLDAVDFDVAVVTNITHEHLDYHGTWENYRDAKALLFRALSTTSRKPLTPKAAVLNADDDERGAFDFLRAIPADERICYSLDKAPAAHADSELWLIARDMRYSADGLRFVAESPLGSIPIVSTLLGSYNVSNILAAICAALARRIPLDAIAHGVNMTRAIPGRMERIELGQPFTVIVDFAHTPNALERALQTVGSMTSGRVIVVFGAAGLRDRAKRAWMGKIAGRTADLTVVTAEDPRTESLDSINAEIARGLEEAGRVRDRDYFIVPDRGNAIRFAIHNLAAPGDTVIITGKGHERSMCFGTTEYPWSDQEAVTAALSPSAR